MRILLVDDEPRVTSALARPLRDAGHEVETAEPSEALGRALRWTPDAVVTDLEMGPLTGVDLVRQLRSHGRAPRCVIMTGNTAFEMPADLRDVGLLEKPFPVASLLAALGLQPPQ